MTDIKKMIKSHEGLRLKLYKDSVNKWSLGYGRNIEDMGISKEEADYLFESDYKRVQKELLTLPWYLGLKLNARDALTDMCFNMGLTRLLEFKTMIMYLQAKNYTGASKEILNSKWATQVGQRAKDVALLMTQGE